MGRFPPARPRDETGEGPDPALLAATLAGPDVLVVLERDGTVRSAAGGDPDAPHAPAPGTRLADTVHPDDANQVAAFLVTVAESDPEHGARGPVTWRLAGSEPRHVEATAANRLDDPDVRGLVVSLRDVDARAQVEAQLRHQASHDPLTDLPNRGYFYDRLEAALAGDGRTVALLYLDMDGFKAVNDRFGHHLGDTVLVELADRLRGTLRADDIAARLGGDEFGVMLDAVSGSNDAVQAAERLLAELEAPLAVLDRDDASLELSPRIGIAVLVSREAGPDELLRRADLALTEAKRDPSRRWALYDPDADFPSGVRRRPGGWFARTHEQRDEVADILDRRDALVAAFQPIMDLRTGLVAGYEALARFPRQPAGSQRNPADWFAQAHRCGLGFELEARAIAAALKVSGRPARTFLSLNVSPSAFVSDPVRAILPDDLRDVVVEITEHEHVSDDQSFHAMRELLRSRGGRLAVDDTGAGYAGLRQLMRLQPDVLKLDRAMVDGVAGDPAKAALIEAMVRYADRIGAEVCAEGIETLADLEALADLDVTFGQGWAIGRPAGGWAGAAAEAGAVCQASYSANLRGASTDEASMMAHDQRLQWLTWKLSEASSYRDLADSVAAIGLELHADELMLSVVDEARGDLVFVGDRGLELLDERYRIADYPTTDRILREQATVQVLVSDPDADPTEVRLLEQLRMGSVLMLPVVCAGRAIGLLEAYSRSERPWSRIEMGRGRIIAFQVGAALERLQRLAV